MNSWIEKFRRDAQRVLDRPLTSAESQDFGNYMLLLVKWHKTQRLVGSADPEWIALHLFVDSLLFLRVIPGGVREVLDLGAGAGVPGIPMRIVRPDLAVTLVEARQRRASFLAEVIRRLSLSRCRVVAERAEAVVEELAGTFDAVVMRCAGTAAMVVPLAKRFVRHGGVVIASGPPNARPTSIGEWVEVPGPEPGKKRRFLIARS